MAFRGRGRRGRSGGSPGGDDTGGGYNYHPSPYITTLKFLLPHGITGSFIGTSGVAISSLKEMTGARVMVSSAEDVFPSTMERIIVVSGTAEQLMAVNALIWHLLANNFDASGKGVRADVWSPTVAIEEARCGVHDDVHCSGRLTVPAAAAGLLLGRNGDTIRAISDESGARVSMGKKDDHTIAETQERVMTVTGPKGCCVRAVARVIAKLSGDPTVAQYTHRGSSYGRDGGGGVDSFGQVRTLCPALPLSSAPCPVL